MSNLKIGISLFSFSASYARGNLNLEGILKKVSELGVNGIEIVGSQMIETYPFVSNDFLESFRELLNKYKIKVISYGANTDKGMYSNRSLTEEEMFQRAILDIKAAQKLGAKIIRVQYLLSPQALKKLAPYAEAYGVKLGVEIHNPETPTTPIMKEYLKVFKETGSSNIGFIPDFGAFANKPNKPYWDLAIEQGAQPELLEKAAELKYAETPKEEAMKQLLELGANGAVIGALQNMYGFVTFRTQPDFEGLKGIMPYTVHLHGKFHHIDENLQEASIPYKELLEIVLDSDYEGYIVSEFEGSEFYDEIEMITRHIKMERTLIENITKGKDANV